MLYIYNESKTKWELNKTKTEGFFLIKKGTTSIGFKPSNELEEKVKKALESNIANSLTLFKLKFAYKTVSPYIVELNNRANDIGIGLVSLTQTRNTEITDIRSNGIKILEFGKEPNVMLNEKYINLVLLVSSTVGSSLTISLLNNDTNKAIEYKIYLDNDGLKVQEKESEATQKKNDKNKYKIVKYRPNRVHNLVIVKKSDSKMVDAFFKDNKYYNKEHHNIIVTDNIEKSLTEQHDKNHYMAATIFLNEPYNAKTVEKYAEKFKKIYRILSIQFVNSNKLTRVI